MWCHLKQIRLKCHVTEHLDQETARRTVLPQQLALVVPVKQGYRATGLQE
jgi:hypothetical protein